jgi:tetratricopeptide (TPR) repeat protein
MGGGELQIRPGDTVAVCEYCGSKQTLPKTTEETLQNLFNRANNLRLKCEFDKAEQIYEKIVQQDDSEAEAHWGIVLCKYGIEYVEDPKTLERIPTCHRTLFDAVTSDPDYLAAIDYSDASQQAIYESEARAIDRIQRDILAIVKNEKPFDVFICYKETDENGKRTIDSTIANDIYYQLTQEGFKVFYAAITLEDKLGQEYEPYIFAALNSAKVMLAIGTKPEYFNAVWVKNEWSRYLKLMKTDRSKLLIPCYRDMDAYDLPDDFAHLQAQDMSKIGFINDVVRGIKKVVHPEGTNDSQAQSVQPTGTGYSETAALLKRIGLFLEDGEFARADEFCEQVLNIDPTNADAYLYKLLVEFKCHSKSDLSSLNAPISNSKNYAKVLRFGSEEQVFFVQNAEKTIEGKRTTKGKEMIQLTYAASFFSSSTQVVIFLDGKNLGILKEGQTAIIRDNEAPEGHHILRIEKVGKCSVFIEKELDTSYFKAIDIWFKAKFDNIWFL